MIVLQTKMNAQPIRMTAMGTQTVRMRLAHSIARVKVVSMGMGRTAQVRNLPR